MKEDVVKIRVRRGS